MRSVIMLHGIQDPPDVLTLTKEEFRQTLEAIQENGYRFAPIKEVLTSSPTDKVVALTFDDGFKSVNVAAEILAEMGASATLFVVTNWVGKTNRWPGQPEGVATRSLLSWSELRALRNAGWDLQAHSHNHPDLRQLPDNHVIRELETCRATLREQLGIESTLFAYPYGYLNRRVYDLVRSRFEFALTTMLEPLPDEFDPHLVPRIDAYYIWPRPVHHYYGRGRFKAYLQARQQLRRWRSHPGEPVLDES